MSRRVLVTSASKHGATFDIADVIAGTLSRRGLEVVDQPIDEVRDVAGFDAAVIGSAVYVGKWMSEAVAFIDAHVDQLDEIPVWLFSSGPLGDPPKPEAEPVTIGELAAKIGARPHRIFPGRLESSQLGLGEKLIVNMVRAPSGDFRDFRAVEAWANEIADTLLAGTPESAWQDTDATREALLAAAGV
jgi:menaquinone-dependent protoporphyrinogen oxidase